MRPGSNNKRMRGRNRRPPNPLARSYESNGPDVKVRGTPQHIADRYLQLARDAQSSGDPVLAESYFQYAEHYLRIVAAAHEQMQTQFGYSPRPESSSDDDLDGDDGEGDGDVSAGGSDAVPSGGFNGQSRSAQRFPNDGASEGGEAQPPMFSTPREPYGDNRNQRFEQRDGFNRQNRNDGNRHNNRQDNYRQNRNRQDFDRQDMNRQDSNRQDFNRANNNRPERQDYNRQDYNRQDNQRQDNQRQDSNRQDGHHRREGYRADLNGEAASDQQPRAGHGEAQAHEPRRFPKEPNAPRETDRPERDHQDRNQRQSVEEQGLPSFITAPVRAVVSPPQSEPAEAFQGDEEPGKSAAEAAPPRKRGRPRRTVEAASGAEDSPVSAAEDVSPLVTK